MRLPILMLVAALAMPAQAGEVELTLMNGEIVHCAILRETDRTLFIRRAVLQRGKRHEVEIELPKERVGGRRQVPSLAEQYAAKAKEVGDSWFDHAVLAAWCAERCLVDEARRHAERALDLDPIAKQPRQVMATLGYAEIKGRWVIEEEYLAANKLVRWGDRYIPEAEGQQRRALAQAIAARDDAIADYRAMEAAAAMSDPAKQAEFAKTVADLERKAAQAEREQERIKAQWKATGERIQQLSKNRSGSNNSKQINEQIANERSKLDRMQEDLGKAASDEAAAKRAHEIAKRKLELAKQGAAAAKTGMPEALARLEAARAEVARLSQGLSDLPPQIKEPADAPKPPAAPAGAASAGAGKDAGEAPGAVPGGKSRL